MTKHYKEVPWYWYAGILVLSFILGLIVVLKENITLPVWAYVVSLLTGIIIAPFVSHFSSVDIVSFFLQTTAPKADHDDNIRAPFFSPALVTALRPTTFPR